MPSMSDEFRRKHILVSDDDQIEQIAAAISRCQQRHTGQMVVANTVICLSNAQFSSLESSRVKQYLDCRATYLSKTVPLAVKMSQMGTLGVYTNTQFTYGMNRQNQISHFEPHPGLVGGTYKRIAIIRALNLDGISIYSTEEFPDTRGFTTHGSSGFLTGATLVDSGETFSQIHLIYSPGSESDVGKTFYAKQGDLLLAQQESWIQWGTEVQQL